MGLFNGESYPVAEELAKKGMYLPSSSGLKEEEIKYICDVIKGIKGRTMTAVLVTCGAGFIGSHLVPIRKI
jgi:hypothetical protein